MWWLRRSIVARQPVQVPYWKRVVKADGVNEGNNNSELRRKALSLSKDMEVRLNENTNMLVISQYGFLWNFISLSSS